MEYHYEPEHNFIYTLNNKGQYHSFNDNPAIIHFNNNTKVWMTDGKLNRDHVIGPALLSKYNLIDDKGKHKIKVNQCYFKNGILHHPTEFAYSIANTVLLYYNGRRR